MLTGQVTGLTKAGFPPLSPLSSKQTSEKYIGANLSLLWLTRTGLTGCFLHFLLGNQLSFSFDLINFAVTLWSRLAEKVALMKSAGDLAGL